MYVCEVTPSTGAVLRIVAMERKTISNLLRDSGRGHQPKQTLNIILFDIICICLLYKSLHVIIKGVLHLVLHKFFKN